MTAARRSAWRNRRLGLGLAALAGWLCLSSAPAKPSQPGGSEFFCSAGEEAEGYSLFAADNYVYFMGTVDGFHLSAFAYVGSPAQRRLLSEHRFFDPALEPALYVNPPRALRRGPPGTVSLRVGNRSLARREPWRRSRAVRIATPELAALMEGGGDLVIAYIDASGRVRRQVIVADDLLERLKERLPALLARVDEDKAHPEERCAPIANSRPIQLP